jgi:nicotinamide-nucleotide amidase
MPTTSTLKLAPVQAEVKRRIANFIIAEDDQTLEGVVLADADGEPAAPLAVAETFTAGIIASRLVAHPAGRHVHAARRGDARSARNCFAPTAASPASRDEDAYDADIAAAAAAVLGPRGAAPPTRWPSSSTSTKGPTGATSAASSRSPSPAPTGTVTRTTRILGGWEWIRLGAAELALDCLRRHLQGLPVHERTDFEKR